MTSSRNIVATSLLGIAALFSAWSIFPSAADWWQSYNWERKFDDEMRKTGVVRLGDLVGFDYECIYFLHAFDFTLPMQQQIDSTHAPFLPSTWGSQRFIYIVYSRRNASPFIARLSSDRFVFPRKRDAKICTRDVSLVALAADDQRCPRTRIERSCIAPVQSARNHGVGMPR